MARARYSLQELTAQYKSDLINVLASEERWAEFLTFDNNVSLSPQNRLRVFSERPDATMVRSFGDWKDAGRTIIKDSVGIPIFVRGDKAVKAPDNTKDGRTTTYPTTGVNVGYVYDISQTTGEPVATLDNAVYGVENYTDYYLAAIIDSAKDVNFEIDDAASKGRYVAKTNTVVLGTKGVSELDVLEQAIRGVAFATVRENVTSLGVVSEQTLPFAAASVSYYLYERFGLDTTKIEFKGMDAARAASSDTQNKLVLAVGNACRDAYSRIWQRAYNVDATVCKHSYIARAYVQNATNNFGAHGKGWDKAEINRFRTTQLKAMDKFASPVAIEIISGNAELKNGCVYSLQQLQDMYPALEDAARGRIEARGDDVSRTTEDIRATCYYTTDASKARMFDCQFELGRKDFSCFYDRFSCELAEHGAKEKFFPEVREWLAEKELSYSDTRVVGIDADRRAVMTDEELRAEEMLAEGVERDYNALGEYSVEEDITEGAIQEYSGFEMER